VAQATSLRTIMVGKPEARPTVARWFYPNPFKPAMPITRAAVAAECWGKE